MLWLPACIEKTDDSETSNGSASSGSTTVEPSTGDPTDGPGSCEAAVDEAGCLAAMGDEFGTPCLWVPLYSLTTTTDACSFEPAGGRCLPPMAGDTDCGSYAAECGFDAYFGTDGDKTLIARVDDSCAYYFTKTVQLALCSQNPDPMTEPLPADACRCACAANYPI